jgi:flagellar M-ring protein FliF
MPVGDIKKLSIAVLVDGTYVKDKKGEETYQPRSKKEIESIEELVRTSAGFNAARGDQVAVTNMPFKKLDAEEGDGDSFWSVQGLSGYFPLIKYLIVFAVIVLSFFFVIKPLMGGIIGQTSEKAIGVDKPDTDVIELTGKSSSTDLVPVPERELTEIELTRKMALEDSRAFAELLRNWLK